MVRALTRLQGVICRSPARCRPRAALYRRSPARLRRTTGGQRARKRRSDGHPSAVDDRPGGSPHRPALAATARADPLARAAWRLRWSGLLAVAASCRRYDVWPLALVGVAGLVLLCPRQRLAPGGSARARPRARLLPARAVTGAASTSGALPWFLLALLRGALPRAVRCAGCRCSGGCRLRPVWLACCGSRARRCVRGSRSAGSPGAGWRSRRPTAPWRRWPRLGGAPLVSFVAGAHRRAARSCRGRRRLTRLDRAARLGDAARSRWPLAVALVLLGGCSCRLRPVARAARRSRSCRATCPHPAWTSTASASGCSRNHVERHRVAGRAGPGRRRSRSPTWCCGRRTPRTSTRSATRTPGR